MKKERTKFWKNVSIVLLGTVAHQVLPLLVLPFFTRILPPSEIGAYFTWLGGVVILSVVLTLRMDMASLQVKGDDDARKLTETVVAWNAFICLVASLFLLGAVVGLSSGIFRREWGWGLEFGALGVIAAALGAVNLLTNSLLVRAAKFKEQAVYKLVLGVLLVVFQTAFVLYFNSALGLVIAHVLSAAVIVGLLLRATGVKPFLSLTAIFSRLRLAFEEQRSFVVYSLPAALLNMLSQYLPLFFVTSKFSASVGGQYGLTQKALSAPLGLVGGAVLAVFREQSSRSYRESGSCIDIYLYTAKSLFLLSFIPFGVLFAFGAEIFSFIFGLEWREAGEFASTLAPAFLIRFIASPLSYMFFLAGRQRWDLAWQGGLLLVTALIFLVEDSAESAVFVYSYSLVFLYSLNILSTYRIAKGGK